MTQWVRFRHQDTTKFGTLSDATIDVHSGGMFESPEATGTRLALADVELLAPCVPSKVIALWNNFHALAAKLNVAEPAEPLYLLKAPTTVTAPNAVVRKPKSYEGKVAYEGELGIVIGKKCSGVSVDEADGFIHGYTCVNDITASDVLNKDPTFPQWARAKGFDDFCPFGPAIVTGIDPAGLTVRTILNGAERQHYRISGHDLFRAGTGQQDLAGDDAAAGRHHRLRHLARCRCDEGAGQQGDRRHRGRRRIDQRVSELKPVPSARRVV